MKITSIKVNIFIWVLRRPWRWWWPWGFKKFNMKFLATLFLDTKTLWICNKTTWQFDDPNQDTHELRIVVHAQEENTMKVTRWTCSFRKKSSLMKIWSCKNLAFFVALSLHVIILCKRNKTIRKPWYEHQIPLKESTVTTSQPRQTHPMKGTRYHKGQNG
jgi:hypothetical protein